MGAGATRPTAAVRLRTAGSPRPRALAGAWTDPGQPERLPGSGAARLGPWLEAGAVGQATAGRNAGSRRWSAAPAVERGVGAGLQEPVVAAGGDQALGVEGQDRGADQG